MENSKRQISNGPEDHLSFALCHLPFAILFSCLPPTAYCLLPTKVTDDG
jgi:hypothetical protein